MTKQPNGLYKIIVGGKTIFTNMEYEESLSGLLTIADHYDGVARVDGYAIMEFNK